MKEMICDKTPRLHVLIKVLGITVLALLILVSIAGATPCYYSNFGDKAISITTNVNVGSNPGEVAVKSITC